MSIRNPQLPAVNCRYGAPMGRTSYCEPDVAEAEPRLRIFRLRAVDGDYDEGGAYWGTASEVFCALSPTGGFQWFVRAATRAEAKAKVREAHAWARFIN